MEPALIPGGSPPGSIDEDRMAPRSPRSRETSEAGEGVAGEGARPSAQVELTPVEPFLEVEERA